MTGKDKLDDAYFTLNLLPDYVTEHGKETEWDVVFDSRGSFIEPHTGREVALGTIDVRAYLGDQAWLGAALGVTSRASYPTSGPEHRYSTVLFIEKEGFAPLLQTARIAERFDIAIMSTKGLSTTAARLLLNRVQFGNRSSSASDHGADHHFGCRICLRTGMDQTTGLKLDAV